MISTKEPAQISSSQERFRGRILQTFLFVFIPLSLLPIVIIGSIVFVRARNLLIEQSYTQIENTLQIISADFDTWLNNSQIRLDSALRNKSFQEASIEILSAENSSIPQFEEHRRYILHHLDTLNQDRGKVNFRHFFILSSSGEIVISSQPAWEGFSLSDDAFTGVYNDTIGSLINLGMPPMMSDEVVILSHVPLKDGNDTIGYIIGVLNTNRLLEILTSVSQFQPNTKSYLVLDNNTFVGLDYYVEELSILTPSQSQLALLPPLKDRLPQTESNENINLALRSFSGERSLSTYTWHTALGAGLVVDIPEAIAFENLHSLTPFTFISLGSLLVLIGIVIWFAARRFSSPLQTLTESTQKFAQGEWDARANVSRNDEIGLLAFTFNQMAEELSSMYASLNTQVQEQTEELRTRSSQFEATAQVAREAAAIHDLDSLLIQTTKLISQHFGYYHAGIFLIDENEMYAILQAANSEGGKKMLERGHKLAVGQTGVVGRVAETGYPRIALNVGVDRFFFDNPDLPETRSEMALPLKAQDRIIGVLDVQSKTPDAFSNSDAEVLQIMADQIALAINNARLLEQTEQTIQELHTLYGERFERGWRQRLGGQTRTFQFDRVRVKPVEAGKMIPYNKFISNRVKRYVDNEGNQILNVPINLRQHTIGTIILRRRSDEPPWADDDLELAQEVTTQIAIALENARLLEESQRRATQEELLSQATARFSQSLNINTVLQMAVRELGQLSGVKEVTVELNPDIPA